MSSSQVSSRPYTAKNFRLAGIPHGPGALILLHMFCWDVWVTGLAIQGGVPTPQPDAGAHTMMSSHDFLRLTSTVSAMFQGFFAWCALTGASASC
ncbi:hypothetical protein L218DRAFT_356325 [Marasmius fiardii PR-910]|nr:hypothetical protein L218DRAFT_356325 [Marasmius fiardii PR-910]